MSNQHRYFFSRLHFKISFVLGAIIILALAVVYIRRENVNRDIDEIAHAYLETRQHSFETSRSSNQELLQALSLDYTIWDEMVRSVQERDMEWFDQNIPIALKTYKADEAWVFSPEHTLVYQTKSDTSQAESFPLKNFASQAPILFKNGFFVEFHAVIDGEMHQVYGAPIQPTADVKRQTVPGGYLFVAREFNSDVLGRLSSINDSEVKITTNNSEYTPDVNAIEGIIRFYDPIYDWEGRKIGSYDVVNHSEILKRAATTLSTQYRSFSIFIILFLGVIAAVVYFLISIPLRRLSESISSGDRARLSRLLRRHDELGEAARLVGQVQEQSAALAISNRELEQSKQRAERHAHETERMNDLMVGRELRMIELKKKLMKIDSSTKSSRGRKGKL